MTKNGMISLPFAKLSDSWTSTDLPSMPVRSRWTNQFTEVPTASNFHNKVRAILATDQLLRGFRCYQEVPVRDLVPEYSGRHYYDWYIDDLNMIVELHGAQHYKVVNYGNISYEDAQRQFRGIQERDRQKKEAAEAAGYVYVAISYKDYPRLDGALLHRILFGAI